MKNSFKKRSLMLMMFLSLTLVVGLIPITSNAKTSGYTWSQFRGDGSNPGITDGKTPIIPGEINEKWSSKMTNGWSLGNPVIVGENIYITADNKLKRVNKQNGQIQKEVEMKEGIAFFSQAAYGDGKIFVPTSSGRIQAFDEETMESLWISKDDNKALNAQGLSPVIYHDGHVYMGITNGNASKGRFYALSTKDEDKTKTDEIKEYTWTYAPENGSKGYYWSGGVIVSGNIIFGGESGEVVVHSLTQDKIIDRIELNEAIRSTIHFDETNNRIYITTKAGRIHSVKINLDGTIDKSTLISTKIGNDVTSSPVSYNGRVYVGGGGITSGDGFTVLDGNTLEKIYSINIGTQSSPILTTAYSTEENKKTVYLYVLGFANPDDIYCIKDFQGNTTPIVEKIATPSKSQYNSSSVAIDEDGTIYFKNDSSNLFAFSSKNGNYTSVDVENAINRLPKEIKLYNQNEIEEVENRYNNLSKEEKNKVKNYESLKASRKALEDLKNEEKEVERINKGVSSLPENITLEHKALVEELFNSYMNLSDEGKKKIENPQKLIQSKKIIEELSLQEEIKKVENEINSLPEIKDITLDNEEQINKVFGMYNNLSEEGKARVSNLQKLVDSKKKLEETKKIVQGINDDIWNKIDPSNITLEDKEVILDIMSRYEKLSEKDKKYVQYYNEVLEAMEKIKELEKENNKKPETGGTTLPQTGGTNPWSVVGLALLLIGSGTILLKSQNR